MKPRPIAPVEGAQSTPWSAIATRLSAEQPHLTQLPMSAEPTFPTIETALFAGIERQLGMLEQVGKINLLSVPILYEVEPAPDGRYVLFSYVFQGSQRPDEPQMLALGIALVIEVQGGWVRPIYTPLERRLDQPFLPHELVFTYSYSAQGVRSWAIGGFLDDERIRAIELVSSSGEAERIALERDSYLRLSGLANITLVRWFDAEGRLFGQQEYGIPPAPTNLAPPPQPDEAQPSSPALEQSFPQVSASAQGALFAFVFDSGSLPADTYPTLLRSTPTIGGELLFYKLLPRDSNQSPYAFGLAYARALPGGWIVTANRLGPPIDPAGERPVLALVSLSQEQTSEGGEPAIGVQVFDERVLSFELHYSSGEVELLERQERNVSRMFNNTRLETALIIVTPGRQIREVHTLDASGERISAHSVQL